MILTQQNPGVHTREATIGALPIELDGFDTMFLVGPALRGPIDQQRLITSPTGFHLLYGRRSATTNLDEAIKAIFEIGTFKCYIQRVAGVGAVKATKNLLGG